MAYAVANAAGAVAWTPVGAAEARLLAGEPDVAGGAACARRAGADLVAAAACALPGAAAGVARVAVAVGRPGGLAAARAACALAAPALVLLLLAAGSSPRWGRRGHLVAATFVAFGVPIQLVAAVHPRGVAAVLLAFGAALLERPRSERPRSERAGAHDGALRAALAGTAFALAVTATPVAALFAVPLAAALARGRAAAASFAAGCGVLAVSGLAGHAAWSGLLDAARALPPDGWSPPAGRLAAIVDDLSMPLLLAAFAMFHRDGGARAAATIALAAPALLVPLLGGDVEEVRTGTLLAFTVLAPAAAVGVAQLGDIFARGNPSRLARPFFAAAVLVVAGVYGVHQARLLRRAPVLAAAALAPGAGANAPRASPAGVVPAEAP
jgi:hypothetical protein